ncbi:nuclear transport factor 2 family protein [Henriciella barbarensis]|uniref:Nuclear transport factor 2 family protein n=1 Tax=Henriciella barbarensis TaxID=86342 RepID=A0A399R1X3_9PROT|nr:nuclear transport factor 2 family protein [Henriciella barbarensis]RIJ23589.1 nuclear transport factor 2 family protein [Henriciella barbarensis]
MRLAYRVPLLAAALLLSACASQGPEPIPAQSAELEIESIETVIRNQAEAWNRGDIDAFMEGYLRSPELRFASGGTVTHGFEPTLSRYKDRYDTRTAMGTLSFTELETVLLSEDAAVVHGRWQLARDLDAPSGLFTLVFRKISGDWQIISDTTTSAN